MGLSVNGSVECPSESIPEVAVVDLQQGFVLTRHWRDTPAGTEVEFWLATDAGPRRMRLPHQTSVAFIPAASASSRGTAARRKNVELRPLACRISSIARCWACIASNTVN
jgi:hypothetical protein